MQGFYKKDISRLLFAPNFVIGQNYSLDIAEKDNYTYPVNGWHWFNTEEEARTFFELPPKNDLPIIPNYVKFWNLLIASPVYQVIRAKAVTSLDVTVACTEFVAAISDAKLGKPNANAIQACIFLLLMASNFTESELQQIQDLMDQSGLNQIYTLTLPS